MKIDEAAYENSHYKIQPKIGYGNQISKMHICLFCRLTVDSFWKVAEILNTETLSYGDIKGFGVTAMA